MAETLVYTPPKTVKAFIKDYVPHALFYDWIVGPVGSGKTTGLFFKLVHMAKLQAPGPDKIRRSRAVVVRNTAPQLKDTTLKSWFTWFKDGQAGTWHETNKTFVLRFDDVECEVLFRPLDTEQDVQRVLSLELTFAILDEFVQIPKAIVEALSARCGRFPAVKDGGATNWGMWGSSNPELEDNWWYDYLHRGLPGNARYFLQPSGYAPDAENLDFLPGGQGYYTQLAEGKSEAWIRQFLEAQWGFSTTGKPVVPTFKAPIHATRGLRYNPLLPLIGGLDPGIGGTALIFGQQTLGGRLVVLGELVEVGIGAERFVRDIVKPYLRRRFPGAAFTVAPDPAAANRSQADEKTVVDVLRRHFAVSVETNNQLRKRLDAIEHFSTRLLEDGPALWVDEVECPVLIRALKGGWRWGLHPKTEVIKTVEPEKNAYSHPGDAFGYLCRYFHQQSERSERQARRPLPPAATAPNTYHFR